MVNPIHLFYAIEISLRPDTSSSSSFWTMNALNGYNFLTSTYLYAVSAGDSTLLDFIFTFFFIVTVTANQYLFYLTTLH